VTEAHRTEICLLYGDPPDGATAFDCPHSRNSSKTQRPRFGTILYVSKSMLCVLHGQLKSNNVVCRIVYEFLIRRIKHVIFPLVLLPDYWFWWNKDFRNIDIHTLICYSSKPWLSTGTSRLQEQGAYPLKLPLITFRVSRTRREMYCGHARLRVCLSAAACLHYCTDPGVTWGSGRGYP